MSKAKGMNEAEALAKATAKWGPDVIVASTSGGLLSIYVKVEGNYETKGLGYTWEEALADAERSDATAKV